MKPKIYGTCALCKFDILTLDYVSCNRHDSTAFHHKECWENWRGCGECFPPEKFTKREFALVPFNEKLAEWKKRMKKNILFSSVTILAYAVDWISTATLFGGFMLWMFGPRVARWLWCNVKNYAPINIANAVERIQG